MQCTAKSKRSKQQCKKWAVRRRNTCHMHGGTARGPKTKIGKERSRQATFHHGGYTKEAIHLHKEAMTLINPHQLNDELQKRGFDLNNLSKEL